jgi:hypothetical protein
MDKKSAFLEVEILITGTIVDKKSDRITAALSEVLGTFPQVETYDFEMCSRTQRRGHLVATVEIKGKNNDDLNSKCDPVAREIKSTLYSIDGADEFDFNFADEYGRPVI